MLVLRLLGVGAMRSPRYAPAGLLIEHGGLRVAIDGGPGGLPPSRLDAWLVTDLRAELIAAIRRAARVRGVEPQVASFVAPGLRIVPHSVAHTSHPTCGYLVESGRACVVWAPEFWRFPRWAAGADLMLAEAAGYARSIHFAGGVGGHMGALDVARRAHACGVRRLVLAHIGRPSIRARDAGEVPPHAEWGSDGDVFVLGTRGA
jgi:hypothetical protein